MSLNFNIPMPDSSGNALLKGIDAGGSLYARIMDPIIKREQLNQQKELEQAKQKQLENHFQMQYGLSKAAAERAAQAAADEHKIAKNKLDPTFQAKQYEAMVNYFKSKAQGNGQPQQDMQQPPMPKQEIGQGMGVFSPQGQQQAQQEPQVAQPQAQQQPSGNPASLGADDLELMKKFPPLRGMYKKMYGIDPLAPVPQTAEEKLQDKMKLENYKTSQQKLLDRQKTIDAAENDLPHLKSTLDALESMKKIATNNPDLFEHNGIFGFGAEGAAERFAKTTDNPNAGAWQTYGLGPIVAAESKMSARGNQLALKQALANKPNFSENQKVAISKIDSSIKQIKQSIQENNKITGKNGYVTVIDPQGKKFKTTSENAANLPAGWKHG